MKYIKIAFWALVAICLIIVALANTQMVTLQVVPRWLAGLVNTSPNVTLPLYAVIMGGIAFGLIIGFIWEWLREYKHRAAKRRKERRVRDLEAEMQRMHVEKHEGDDEVLMLLDKPAARA